MVATRSHLVHAPPTKRQPATDDVQGSIVAQAANDPIGAAAAAQGLDNVKNYLQGGDQAQYTLIQDDANNPSAQYPWNQNVGTNPNANAQAGANADGNSQGWVGLPQLQMFDLKRDQVIKENATQPYYITSNYNPALIKKAVIVMPGKPRDSWKYTDLVYNSMQTAAINHPEWQIDNKTILVIGPAWLNQFDQQYGAANPMDLVFHGSQWQSGGYSRSPQLNHSITTYEVLDWFTDWLFNTTNFPNLNGVTFAGHSMGGQAVARYALVKKQKKYDDNISYWMGNPGSWAWLSDQRPFQNASCTDFDNWPYGIGGNQTKVTKYARKDVIADKQAILDRFKTRKVHYALGLLDNGPGDTHCQAVMQGGNHLDRGSNFIQQFKDLGGFPSTHTATFVANASHQDYAMLSANASMNFLFVDGASQRNPDITPHNPSDKNKTTSSGPDPNPKPKAFATPIHKIISYALLGGSVGLISLIFIILPFCFPANSDPWEQEKWENDSKRQLL
ncbi:hypothetical protein FA10DRAFT_231022 [Acaromyces ingoldii]|uniref:Alpha/beta-hydrolase n=1 Tax=Acaromyces ingoldii TaxID=215250 RepID=A0A316YK11_9BASI|nr:hypothetical protein FA10DRAFT_231022 [Acaromyces ingoldii]PWN89890.1 hypothetical protein FA10DRAFT_231022 [Acaromyces ingoldii]